MEAETRWEGPLTKRAAGLGSIRCAKSESRASEAWSSRLGGEWDRDVNEGEG